MKPKLKRFKIHLDEVAITIADKWMSKAKLPIDLFIQYVDKLEN